MSRHLRFVARTIMVKNNNIDDAYSTLSRYLFRDGIIKASRNKRYYEKPCQERRRNNYENCKRIYHLEMSRKISFISRTNREDPWVGF